MTKKRKGKDEAKDGEQFEKFVEAAENVGPYDEKVLDDAIKKIVKTKPKQGTDKKKDP